MDDADAGHFDSQRANTSRRLDAEPVQENVVYQAQNCNDDYYDMRKNKYLHIFNHYAFRQTREFGNKLPKERTGTHFDVKILEDTFKPLGFKVEKHQDLSYNKIIRAVENIINQDHKDTSCVALAILTHGSYDGYLFAKDQPYELKEITKMLENQKLALIPKLLFLQVSVRIDNMHPQPRVDKVLRRMNSWRSSINRYRRSIAPQILACIRSPESNSMTDGVPANDVACRGQALDKGHQIEVDGLPRHQIHVPSHIDFLILHSAADGHASFRCNEEGSWMIQQLCKVITQYHSTHDILQLITLVNRRVAYNFTAHNLLYPSYNMKKQSLEARYTLTKFLKL